MDCDAISQGIAGGIFNMQVKAGGGIIKQAYTGDLCEDKKFNGKQFGAAAKTPLDGTAAHMKACQGRECHWACVGKSWH